MDNGGSYNDPGIYNGNQEDNQQSDHKLAGDWDNDLNIEESESNNIDGSEYDDNHVPNDIDLGEEDTTVRRHTQRNKQSIAASLPRAIIGSGLDRKYWRQLGLHICPTVSAMGVAEQAGIQMMKEYFEIEASKSTPQYGFRKGLEVFGGDGYQVTKE